VLTFYSALNLDALRTALCPSVATPLWVRFCPSLPAFFDVWRTLSLSIDASAQIVWEAALGRLQLQVTRPSFDTWLRDTVGRSITEEELIVSVPSTFIAEWLKQRMQGLIQSAVESVSQKTLRVVFHVAGATDREQTAPTMPEPPPGGRGREAPALNHKYTLESFIVGPSNRLAHAAAEAVGDGGDSTYNPLFIHGAVGLGKTHLLHAIAHRLRRHGKTFLYVSAEQFTNEFISAIRERRTQEFRAKYRPVQVLLMDDIQFLSGKEGSQEAFFHTFNALHDSNRQIVLTSDRQAGALPLIDERLRSRLQWGLTADIGAPDLETRLAILAQHASAAPVPVPNEVIELIAQRLPSNIRALEGCLNKVTALAHFTNHPVSLALTEAALSAIVVETAGPSSPKAVLAAVADHYQIPPAAIIGPSRDRKSARARQVAIHILATSFSLTPQEIGRALGQRDRTTIIYSLRKIQNELAQSLDLVPDIKAITRALQT
jgi:chromosomal replication initiator protein